MKKYEVKEFNLPKIEGISEDQIKVHLGLYEGYVKNLNSLYERIEKAKESPEDAHGISSLIRRIGFELAGIKNHENFFEALNDGAKALPESKLKTLIEKNYGSLDNMIEEIKQIAKTMRGIGWIMVINDKDKLHTIWVSDHELGGVSLPSVFVVDMWEHAYMVDYKPSEKLSYVSAYLNAVNWEIVSKNYENYFL